MPNAKHKPYDDDELVLAIASGTQSHSQIARDFGLSPAMIHFIVSGKRRPELQGRIRATVAEFRDRSLRLTAHMAASAAARLGKLVSDELNHRPDIQLRAAGLILKFALASPPPAGRTRSRPPPGVVAEEEARPDGFYERMMSLPDEARSKVVRLLGGPSDDPRQDDMWRTPEELAALEKLPYTPEEEMAGDCLWDDPPESAGPAGGGLRAGQ